MSKMIFSTIGSKMTFDDITVYLTDLSFSEKSNKIDVTDTGTTGDGTEFVYSRVERPFTVDSWKDSATADLPIRTKKACTIQYENNKYIGSASFESKDIKGSIDTGVKITYTGVFEGSISASLS